MKIDFVIPWVDGSDPEWIALRNRYAENPEDSDASRYRDWEILRYWFRAVEQHAPWVNRIYFISCGQIPHWLNRDHPKLCLVDHRDYIPAEYLPTFSSHTIELNLHRIQELSEHFVYFNDDMFLNADVTQDDFFFQGLPKDCAVLDKAAPLQKNDAYSHAQRNGIAFLNEHFRKRQVLMRHPALWFSPLYGKYILKNILCGFHREFHGIKSFHIPSSMRRSTYETLWTLEQELLDQTCRNRFRSNGDVNQYIMRYYDLCSGNFYPRSHRFGKCYRLELDREEMLEDIRTGIHKVICINDHPGVSDFHTEKTKLIQVFRRKYPMRSSFETNENP